MRNRFAWLIGAAVFVLTFSVAASAVQSAKVDVSGAWIFTVESAAGSSTPAVIFKQDGEKLTGSYSSQLMGEAKLSGTVKGEAIEFVVSSNVQGVQIELKYTGTIEGQDSMKGKLSAGEFGDGTFTAKRKQ